MSDEEKAYLDINGELPAWFTKDWLQKKARKRQTGKRANTNGTGLTKERLRLPQSEPADRGPLPAVGLQGALTWKLVFIVFTVFGAAQPGGVNTLGCFQGGPSPEV